MLKSEKIKFVKDAKADLKKYKTVAVMPIEAVPDRLVQKIRNRLKPDSKFIIARKTLIMRILEGSNGRDKLVPDIKGNIALILSNDDPLELYSKVSSSPIKLSAKPNQIAPGDINIESGETSILPGQAVTDLKTAGIDVKIDKGKVVISKSKVLVTKGTKITTPISKALKMLDIQPFSASGRLTSAFNEGIIFNENVLKVNQEFVIAEVSRIFSAANALTIQIKYVTPYNVPMFIGKAVNEAIALGVDAKIYEKEIVQKLLGIASLQAGGVNALVKKE